MGGDPTRERGRPARMHSRWVPLSFPAMRHPATLPAGAAWARPKQSPGGAAGRARWRRMNQAAGSLCGRDARARCWGTGSKASTGKFFVHIDAQDAQDLSGDGWEACTRKSEAYQGSSSAFREVAGRTFPPPHQREDPTRERGRPARMHSRWVPLSFPAMRHPATLPAGTAWAGPKQSPRRRCRLSRVE